MNITEIYQGSSFLNSFRKYLITFLIIIIFNSCSSSSLEKIEIIIAGEKFIVEVAREPEDLTKGLMFRESLGEREGMLFAYEYDKPLKFWNNNVNFPLSLAFITKTGMIIQIEHMDADDPDSVYSKYSVRYALEVNEGIFEELGVSIKDYIIFPEGFK
jgi:uncharacterized protein